ncbi:UDP-N-acetylglucosamine 2-epimerase (non-hydrolyzing) [Lentimicrobium sp. L6]|uniref:non-hydrolyzing UDP-N-acetylglucosamine 2-epimerase n=1 Tax=Lentimicrobium sp. L6 TaxID=2735916 RepID=UPI001556B7FA|nr:UDP-N-acetylglucosamine 2-epimerase (non-hydrolyzing) [Lentimicrobium sp. L6]NPD86989.1 UDP-N-acetylglucosamine 2-epimerase (non-hydrolyzing) [Lentimicrobium sp. L6]
MKIISVVGARPNFMKIAPFIKEIQAHNAKSGGPKTESLEPIEHILVHTGQHYDDRMSKAFFEALEIPEADINLGIGSGTHAEQVGLTMMAFEKVLKEEKPDWVVVLGDVNATLACSVTAKKEHIKVCHIEAGLRSRDMNMPEEINRLVTDRLSDLLLTPDTLSIKNLKQEGATDKQVAFVGNIMIDTLEANRDKARLLEIPAVLEENKLEGHEVHYDETLNYGLVTLHRPSNVDKKEVLEALVRFLLDEVCQDMQLIWPVHPRTKKNLQNFGLWEEMEQHPRMILQYPLGYHELLRLNMDASIMLTDSGGLQEECTILGTPCLTLRWNTERPITLKEHGGASVLVGNNVERIREEYLVILKEDRKPIRPELWDGKTASRCLVALLKY